MRDEVEATLWSKILITLAWPQEATVGGNMDWNVILAEYEGWPSQNIPNKQPLRAGFPELNAAASFPPKQCPFPAPPLLYMLLPYPATQVSLMVSPMSQTT